MLFLGSGISRPTWENANSTSGESIPDVTGITRATLSGPWKWDGTEQAFVSRPAEEAVCVEAERCQKFLQRLYFRVSSYYEERRDVLLNYEDLFHLTDQFRSSQINVAIQPFREQMLVACGDLCFWPQFASRPTTFEELCNKVCDFIQCVVWKQLHRDVVPQGMDLIVDLAARASKRERIERLAICTLNHDTLVEKLLEDLEYEDGFEALENGGFFDARRLRATSRRIRLLKLHGSINWYRYQRREGEHYEDHYAAHKWGWKRPVDGNGVKWHKDPIPRVLTGSYNKFEAYGTDITKEFIHAFHSELAEHRLIVMSGYGWGDYAINQRLCDWLGSDSSHRIVLLHEHDPIPMFRDSHIIWTQYDRLLRLGKIVVVRKWLQDFTKLEEVFEQIEQADRLSLCKAPNPTDLLL